MSISLNGAHHSKQHSGLKPFGHFPPSAQSTHARKTEGALPPVETDDSLNAGWDGPSSRNVSAAAMTGDSVLLFTDLEDERRTQVRSSTSSGHR